MSHNRRQLLGSAAFAAAALAVPALAVPAFASPKAEKPASRKDIERTMREATRFMVEEVSTNGGYVWSYLPDKSRRWGELEAYPSMIWVQPPGTPTMGHVFLDAYHATGDEYYYQAAEKVADALICGQLPTGGWNYFIDFDGEASTRQWYDTIGKNAWRMEEFQHYWGNATFDDLGTSEAAQLLLRIYVEKRDPKYRPALDKTINFILESQYPIGGWPQRYPLKYEFSHHGNPDYTSYITFNDAVTAENVKFLILCYQALGETRVLDTITRGMSIYITTQQGAPQAGWGLQYTLDLKPSKARTYEPNSLSTDTTYDCVRQLMHFYRLTGDTKYLNGIPAALDWLDSVRLPDAGGMTNRHPIFIEIGTNKAIYVHRRGSNIVNGEYYWDYEPSHTLGHYAAVRSLDVPKLRKEFETLVAVSPAEASKASPLKTKVPLARYFVTTSEATSDLNSGKAHSDAGKLVSSLNAEGYWPTELTATSNPYIGDGPVTPPAGDFRSTRVGDATDTSPYIADKAFSGISTGTYIENMQTLIGVLRSGDRAPVN
jgi:PelA/Pel-15E family pectate lyase